jgi:hypothetical protein
MAPAREPTRAVFAGSLVTLLVTALVLHRSLADGLVLLRDDVQVSHPAWSGALLGLGSGPPRAVPFGAVQYWLGEVVGPAASQRLVLAAPLALAGVGVAVLLRRAGAPAAAVGALVAVWNPYVVERLGLGQSPTLLAYGALPWLLVATCVRRSTSRRAAWTALAFVPAALTPIGSVIGLGTVVVGLAARRVTRLSAALTAAGPVLMCAPWVVAGLLADVATGESDGAAAYAAMADSPWGLVGSVATLGGVWTPVAVPPSREHVGTGIAALLLLVAAAAGWSRHRRRWWLLAAWAVPVGAVCVAATGPVVSVLGPAQSVPGLALLRDTHRLLAPAAVAVALGAGLLAGMVSRARVPVSPGGGLVRGSAVLALTACSVLTVPDLAAVVAREYQPVAPPSSWSRALQLAGGDGTSVLSLPWQPLRQTPWNENRVFLDPVPLAVGSQTLHSTRLVVRRAGRRLVTDRDAVDPSPGWLTGQLTQDQLRRREVGWVVEDRLSPGPVVQARGLELVLDRPEVRLWRVPGESRPVGLSTARLWVAWSAFGVAGAVLVGSILVLVGNALRRGSRRARRHGPGHPAKGWAER